MMRSWRILCCERAQRDFVASTQGSLPSSEAVQHIRVAPPKLPSWTAHCGHPAADPYAAVAARIADFRCNRKFWWGRTRSLRDEAAIDQIQGEIRSRRQNSLRHSLSSISVQSGNGITRQTALMFSNQTNTDRKGRSYARVAWGSPGAFHMIDPAS